MTDPTRQSDADALRDKRRVAWAGVVLNGPLAAGKILAGLLAHSQALVADGVHSLSDLASDAAVIWALGHSHRPPDTEHPFGHGRFETLATLAIAAMLTFAAAGILIDAGLRLMDPPTTAPGMLALWVAGLAIALKEGLYHYTRAVARRTGSTMMAANAWHHRSDAATSVVALGGDWRGDAGLAPGGCAGCGDHRHDAGARGLAIRPPRDPRTGGHRPLCGHGRSHHPRAGGHTRRARCP